MDVVSRSCADGAQQGAIDPRDDRAVEFPRTFKALPVLVHRRHEDVLHLQIAARMEKRQCIGETFGRPARDVKPDVGGRRIEQIVEVLAAEARRHMRIVPVVDRAEPFFEATCGPDEEPEGDSSHAILESYGYKVVIAADETWD